MYEEREMRMVDEIVRTIKDALTAGGVEGAALRALTEEISFSMAAIIDGSAYMELNDDHLVPVLGFAEGRMRDRLLVPLEGGSSLHGLVPGYIEANFGEEID
ncbi:hypothetical protein [Pseudoduganella ginsengisoli]|uniref:Uncharacterized protein n=1 Tax=Pseudoduganella ginsengisoli TaxID=1462440 RepID=A0A6L6Q019_9BURK|nr:hypothetical protein [Pseudoduganella ginsengisoli]MTW03233.1 hypothetical protein [Pseudoduganella ginsengisoli]